jgi:hypothetical protein
MLKFTTQYGFHELLLNQSTYRNSVCFVTQLFDIHFPVVSVIITSKSHNKMRY